MASPPWAIVKERGYQGLVAKDQESAYYGGTSRAWLKLKVRHEGAFAIGFVERFHARGDRRDHRSDSAPDRAAVWLEPELLAEIAHSELMDGWLRDPSAAVPSGKV